MEGEKNKDRLILIYEHPQWKDIIKPQLEILAQGKEPIKNVILHLKQFKIYSTVFRDFRKQIFRRKDVVPSFQMGAHSYRDSFLWVVANAAQMILSFQSNPPEFPIFKQQVAMQHNFKKYEVLYLLCTMFLSLVMTQKSTKLGFSNDFSYILSESRYKTTTIVEYLKQELSLWKSFQEKEESSTQNQEILTIRRNVEKKQVSQIIKEYENLVMGPIQVTDDNQSIEDFYGTIKADFANKFIGGGSLTTGCVQEQIMFANHPELYISMTFCQVMQQNESIFFAGFKKYFKNKGYGWTTSYDGEEAFQYKLDDKNRFGEYITAIDAVNYNRRHDQWQFSPEQIDRQILKAYTGFNVKESEEITTGNWGCGAFRGNIPLKFMIQWIACSLASKKMRYVPFGYKSNIMRHAGALEIVSKMKIPDVYSLLLESASQIKHQKMNIFDKIGAKIQI